jgi:glycosyltransferase involved in cell wall biosynthesis/LmbE family N-acetylglucosaminyl deacetylase
MLEENLIPYQACTAIPANAVLVLAPHPDDEVFGCGGAIAHHCSAAIPVHVLILSNGDRQGNSVVRQKESQSAASVLGYQEPIFWGLPDRAILYSNSLVAKLLELVNQLKIDLIYCPSPYELHPDHRQTAMLANEVLRQTQGRLRIAFYEISAPLRPNLLLDISSFYEQKEKAIQCFTSQINIQAYGDQILALNRYRTYSLPSVIKAAEAFWVIDAKNGLDNPIHLISPKPVKEFTDKLPLVNILIRSIDRPLLAECLASIALQTYPNISVIVIAAVVDHGALPKFCGSFPIHLIPSNQVLPRSIAANRALDQAQGDYILFLDDDDWLMPDHIERLVTCLRNNSLYRAAFSAVVLVDINNKPTGSIFDFPYDPVQLNARNLFPIHSVLFARSLVDEGCRFSEDLILFEDWDFWLQLTKRTLIAKISGISAAYRIHQSSGVHEDDTKPQREELYKKWTTLINNEGLSVIMQRLWQYSELLNDSTYYQQLSDTQLQQNKRFQKQLERQLQEINLQQKQVELIQTQLNQVFSSKSWRITAPFRFLGSRVRQLLRYRNYGFQLLTQPLELIRITKRAIQIYRTHGASGIRLAIHNKERLIQDYDAWIRLAEPAKEHYPLLLERIRAWPKPVRISILMPTFNSNLDYLRKAIASVQEQIYPHWQLCIADDASEDSRVRLLITEATKNDPRICYVFRSNNGHISEASNSALALANGEYCCLLDHDDLLHPLALWHLAKAINEHPDASLLFSDEDKINSDEKRCIPYFKCDFNPELMLAHNMISHLGCYRTSEMHAIDGFRIGFEGSQDYDLALRIIERSKPEQIIHIPHILYHWRITPQSTASGLEAKSYAQSASINAIEEHLDRRGLRGKVTPCPDLPHIGCRVQFECPTPQPKVSILIPTRDKAKLLKKCINSILYNSTYSNYEIIIIDNGSIEKNTINLFAELQSKGVKIVHDNRPFNYSVLNNHAAKLASGDFLCLMNNDIEIISPAWLEEMVSFAAQADIGAVGARLWYPDLTIQHAGVIVGLGGVAGHAFVNLKKGDPGYFGRAIVHQSYSAVTGACLVIQKTIYDEIGGLNEDLAIAFNDVDFCLRVRKAGYRNVWTPYAEMLHHESASRGIEDTPMKVQRFESEMDYMRRHWANIIEYDPAYSPNLSLGTHHFEMAYPPRTKII